MWTRPNKRNLENVLHRLETIYTVYLNKTVPCLTISRSPIHYSRWEGFLFEKSCRNGHWYNSNLWALDSSLLSSIYGFNTKICLGYKSINVFYNDLLIITICCHAGDWLTGSQLGAIFPQQLVQWGRIDSGRARFSCFTKKITKKVIQHFLNTQPLAWMFLHYIRKKEEDKKKYYLYVICSSRHVRRHKL